MIINKSFSLLDQISLAQSADTEWFPEPQLNGPSKWIGSGFLLGDEEER